MTTKQAEQTASTGTESPSGGPGFLQRVGQVVNKLLSFRPSSVIIATVALILMIGILHPKFIEPSHLADVLQSSIYTGTMAMALACLIAMRDIDLSAGTAYALTVTVAALLMRGGMDPWLAALCTLCVGVLCGLFNAAVVTFIRIPTIITTLATLSMFGGMAVGLANGRQVVGLPADSSFFQIVGGDVGGFPVGVLIMLAASIPLAIAMHHTPWGHRVLAMGSNPDAAEFSGISPRRVRTQVLMLVGLMAGISGCLALAYFVSADPGIGTGETTLLSIAAAVIGGTPLRGGSVSILGAMVGAVLLNVVDSGLPFFGIEANWNEFVTGIVIIVAVGLDSLIRFQQSRNAAKAAL